MNRGSPGRAGDHATKTERGAGRAIRRALLAVVLAVAVAPTQAYYASEDMLDRAAHNCNSAQFPCNDNTCIDIKWVCDENDDCPDGEDEFCDRAIGSSSSSSSSTPGPGGRMGVRSIGCEIPKTDSSGLVNSPNHPLIYEEDFECDYVFIAEPDMRVQLTFNHFDLECSTCACCDTIELREQDAVSGDTFCCSDSPNVYTSVGNVLILDFKTRTSDPSQLPTSALVSSRMEDYYEGVLGALGRSAAANNRHGFEVSYKHVPAN